MREMLGANYSASSDSKSFIGYVPLTERLENLDDLNIFYVRQQIHLNECDIYIATTSKSHISKFEVPKYINRLLKHIDCSITLSFEVD